MDFVLQTDLNIKSAGGNYYEIEHRGFTIQLNIQRYKNKVTGYESKFIFAVSGRYYNYFFDFAVENEVDEGCSRIYYIFENGYEHVKTPGTLLQNLWLSNVPTCDVLEAIVDQIINKYNDHVQRYGNKDENIQYCSMCYRTDKKAQLEENNRLRSLCEEIIANCNAMQQDIHKLGWASYMYVESMNKKLSNMEKILRHRKDQ